MAFSKFNPGCCCVTCQLCVTVAGCCVGGLQSQLAGATVTVLTSPGGVIVATGTTDATGKACIPISVAGSYKYTVSHAGYTTFTSSAFSISCPGNTNVSVQLSNDAGHRCCCVGAVSYPWTISGAGFATQAYTIGGVTINVSYNNLYPCQSNPCAATPVSGTTCVTFTGFGSCACNVLNQSWYYGCASAPLPYQGCCSNFTQGFPSVSGTYSGGCAGSPWVFTFPATDPVSGCPVPVPGTVTISI